MTEHDDQNRPPWILPTEPTDPATPTPTWGEQVEPTLPLELGSAEGAGRLGSGPAAPSAVPPGAFPGWAAGSGPASGPTAPSDPAAPYGQVPPAGPGSAWGGAWSAPTAAPTGRARHRTAAGAVALVVAGALAGGGAYGLATRGTPADPQTSATTAPTIPQQGLPDGSTGSSDGSGSSGGGAADQGSGSASGLDVGVVDIVTTLGYQNGQAAGTGMVLTSDGEVLTNNHVIKGATDITVTYVATGKSYKASVVGYDASHDVAVIKMQDASGLTPVTTSSNDVQTGDSVTAVGNAGGQGGTPDHASGRVTGTGQSITATDESGGDAETLSDLIETDAGIVAGDSGGPLYDTQGRVVGMDTAGSTSGSGFRFSQSSGTTDGYAIPIGDALDIVKKIENGDDSGTIHLGATGLLGVTLTDSTDQSGGALVEGVVDGGAAANAGLAAGDTITAVGDNGISSVADLRTALLHKQPGDHVKVTYVDSSGSEQTTTVTLTEGPPQ